MNDRFKFRVFYEPHKKIYNVICLNCDKQKEIIIEYKGSSAIVEWKNCKILQCTGLKDKNGELLYEADIVKFKNIDNKYYVGTIKYTDDDALFCLSYKNENNREDWDYVSKYRLEVIGNIYEDKDLLNENS